MKSDMAEPIANAAKAIKSGHFWKRRNMSFCVASMACVIRCRMLCCVTCAIPLNGLLEIILIFWAGAVLKTCGDACSFCKLDWNCCVKWWRSANFVAGAVHRENLVFWGMRAQYFSCWDVASHDMLFSFTGMALRDIPTWVIACQKTLSVTGAMLGTVFFLRWSLFLLAGTARQRMFGASKSLIYSDLGIFRYHWGTNQLLRRASAEVNTLLDKHLAPWPHAWRLSMVSWKSFNSVPADNPTWQKHAVEKRFTWIYDG